MTASRIDFSHINVAAQSARWLLLDSFPGGKMQGAEYVARNPLRNDKAAGSLKINTLTGKWADFALDNVGGGDFVSLYAYRWSCSQSDAARDLADKLKVPLHGSGHKLNGYGGALHHAAPAASAIKNTEPPPEVYGWGDDGPPAGLDELRRRRYSVDDFVHRIKIKKANGEFSNAYRVFEAGVPIGWQFKKPSNYKPIPYKSTSIDPFDAELIADTLPWPEGERDCDSLSKVNLPAFTFGGVGDGLPDGIARYLKDRRLAILADNDSPGETHAEKKAQVAHAAGAAEIKIIRFPDLPPKADVSDFFDNGGTAEQLQQRIDAGPIWEPAHPKAEKKGSSPIGEPTTDAVEVEIARLAGLSQLQYELERTAVAERLGLRASILDSFVKAARPAATKGQGRAFELPTIEPWAEPINGAELLNEICAAIRRYIVMSLESVVALTLWAVHTHCFDIFPHTPRLGIGSPEKGCGKTTTLDVLERMVARPLPTANTTASVIFRVVELSAPTLLIDEADTFLADNDDLRGILNSGHRRGGQVTRNVGDDHEPRQFSTYAPAAIAKIGALPDTLNDRSVVINLRRRKPSEKVESFRSDRAGHIRLHSGQTAKGYYRSAFNDAFERYLPSQSVTPSQPNNHGHCDALQSVTSQNLVTLSETSQLNNDRHCDVVTVSNPLSRLNEAEGGCPMTNKLKPISEPHTVAEWWKNRSGESIRIRLCSYEGHNLVDIRTWYTDPNGRLQPGKGFAARIKHLPRLVAEMAKAEAKARELGLIAVEVSDV